MIAIKSSRVATCVLERGGTLKCWGSNQCGSLGISDNCLGTHVYEPTVVHGELEIEDFGLDDDIACALTRAAGIQCWGLLGSDGHTQPNTFESANAGPRRRSAGIAGRRR